MSNHFINPYTFIPIPSEEPERLDISESRGKLTGYLECSMDIKSPTFIPNTSKKFNGGVTEHYKYEFYSYDKLCKNEFPKEPPKAPIIPGSEIRGMIRNVYEQLTNSCFPVVDENNLPYKRTNEIKKPYLLKWVNNQWVLFSKPIVKKLEYSENTESMTTGAMVSVIEERTTKNGLHLCKINPDGRGQYMLHKTGKMDKKRDTIVDINSGTKLRAVGKDVLDRFVKVINSYWKSLPDVYEPYNNLYMNNKTLLVYADDTLTYLSPACMTKEFFVSTIDSILDKQFKHNNCKNSAEACPACRLFGMIGDESAIASRVRFSDAAETSGSPSFEERLLPILGTPRISATEFYLKSPSNNAKIWNYDYYTTHSERTMPNGKTKTFIVRNKYVPTLAGRKVYWHGKSKLGDKIEAGNQNCTARVLKEGKFSFRVYFDGVTDDELKRLIFCLTLNGEGLHKIGRGKPVGMGDNIITVNKVKIRTYAKEADGTISASWDDEKQTKYSKYLSCKFTAIDLSCASLNIKKDWISNILTYTKPLSDEESEIVHYPLLPENDGIFAWFQKNRGSVSKPEIKHTLPEIGQNKMLPSNPMVIDSENESYTSEIGQNKMLPSNPAENPVHAGGGRGGHNHRQKNSGKKETTSLLSDAAIKKASKKRW